jgi:hypothetical protein
MKEHEIVAMVAASILSAFPVLVGSSILAADQDPTNQDGEAMRGRRARTMAIAWARALLDDSLAWEQREGSVQSHEPTQA